MEKNREIRQITQLSNKQEFRKHNLPLPKYLNNVRIIPKSIKERMTQTAKVYLHDFILGKSETLVSILIVH